MGGVASQPVYWIGQGWLMKGRRWRQSDTTRRNDWRGQGAVWLALNHSGSQFSQG